MKLCIYCQTKRATTRDHIPPRGLFGDPPPPNLLTVPACAECNAAFKNDDDYFLTIATEWSASETKDGSAVTKKRLRAIKRPDARRQWKPFLESLEFVEAKTASGIYLGPTLMFRLDGKRISNTINRIVRGLYFIETQTVLPVSENVMSEPFAHYVRRHENNPQAMEMVPIIPGLPRKVIGGDSFEYRCFLDDRPHLSFWYLEFYGKLAFIGATGDHSDPNGEPAEGETVVSRIDFTIKEHQ